VGRRDVGGHKARFFHSSAVFRSDVPQTGARTVTRLTAWSESAGTRPQPREYDAEHVVGRHDAPVT